MGERTQEQLKEMELVERAKTDEKAFRELYELYFPKIYGYVLKRVGKREIAEDLVSEVFMKVFAKIDIYTDKGYSFGAWIFKITGNLLIDYYRKESGKITVNIEECLEMPGEQKGDSLTLTNEAKREVEKYLLCLAERERKAVELKFFAELSNLEIAEILGVSANNVGVILYRALKNMRRIDL